jgi:hypothetical protein
MALSGVLSSCDSVPKLVLQPVRFVGLLVGARVLDGESGAGRHVLRETKIRGDIHTP